jgi:hypothetical protein
VALVVGLGFARFWLMMVLVDVAYLGSLGYALATRRRRVTPAGG